MNTPTPLQSIPPQPLYPVNPPGYPQMNRTATPVKVFGIIYAVFAVLSVFGFLVMAALAFIPGVAGQYYGHTDGISSAAPMFLFGFIAIVIGIIIVIQAAAAYGLLTLRPWGRTMAIVTSIISCLSIPFGTILGGIALYFLLRQGAEQEYSRLVMERNHYPGTL